MKWKIQWRQATLSWLFVGALFVLCGLLGVLQYRWIGEVSLAARDRLAAGLRASLERVSRDFQSEIAQACRAIAPEDTFTAPASLAAQVSVRYVAWKASGPPSHIFRAVGLAAREGETVVLRMPDASGRFQPAAWPSQWKPIEDWLAGMALREGRGFRGPAPPTSEETAFELPLFNAFAPGQPDLAGPQRRNSAWMIFDLDPKYVGEILIPELLQRHFGTAGSLEYQYEIVPRANPSSVLFPHGATLDTRIAANADASVGLFEMQPDLLRPRGGRGPSPEGFRGAGPGRWQMYVRHRAGSLEAVVAKARRRNLAVTGGVLLLILASAAALIRFTRRAERLAQLQINFVAGVSHELRTPLTVINTAAYNLQGAVARNPESVARYGALIRQESGRLKDLVEQVLSFAGSNAGSLIHEMQPLSVEQVVEAGLDSSRSVIEGAGCVVETTIQPGLPPIAGDPRALQHALQNLVSNAIKYGARDGSCWVGISAGETAAGGNSFVEIRVTDRGPGIPADEQSHIFDPFFRGKRALQDQVHGTGLGLTLVRDIVKAHDGSIAVHSQPGKGTEFIVRIPAAPQEYRDEFANTTRRG